MSRAPGNSRLYAAYATALAKCGRPNDALNAIGEAVTRFPTMFHLDLTKAEILRSVGDLEGACAAVDAAAGKGAHQKTVALARRRIVQAGYSLMPAAAGSGNRV
ncbi:hypothetical protein SAMN02745194_00493 [Roseomonas rosea]|uniref:Tetratricopeptide repeat-containing protein n=1 Tax=Muricoccus roseus TaxID=198092 RepID=A0A1M6BGN5_9PROT|nr:hypothetical protein SAMN02745194_00493 [Roseomonas rosea]